MAKKGRPVKSISILGSAFLFAALLAAYSNHFHNGFHYDDGHTIVNNAAIRELRNIPLFFRDATTFSTLPSNQSYRPLVSTLLAIDYRLGHGLQSLWFHLSIFALFVTLTLLLAVVIYHLLESNATSSPGRWIALGAAAAYALNPANADAINYIIVSAEVISTLGVIASFACYFAFPRLRRYALFVLPAALAIMAKPTAAIFPVLFTVFRLLFREPSVARRRRPAPAWFVEVLPPFVICGAALLLVQHMTPRSWTAGAPNSQDYLVTQPYVALLYFKTFFWPGGLSADYDLQPLVTLSDPRLWIGFAFVVILSAAAIRTSISRKTRLIGFGLLWFLLALLPTALFPLAEVMNDYRAFLAYIGLAIALAGGAALLVPRWERQRSWMKIAATGVIVLFLCANAFATFQRNKVWQTEETLWRDVALKSPRNGRGLMAYGVQLLNKGDYVGALEYFHRAQKLTPEYYRLLINLAIAENATNQSELAEEHFKDALRRAPNDPETEIYYARYLLAHGRVSEARANLQRALVLSPNDTTARELLNKTKVVDAEPHITLGNARLGRGRFGEAIAEYEAALQIAPESLSTLNNLAWVLSTCPDASQRNGVRALALAKKGDQLAGGDNAVILRTLAAAYAENARFDDAMETAQRALQFALARPDSSALAAKLEKDIDFYRNHLPLHPIDSRKGPP